jgi:hypothetical protein
MGSLRFTRTDHNAPLAHTQTVEGETPLQVLREVGRTELLSQSGVLIDRGVSTPQLHQLCSHHLRGGRCRPAQGMGQLHGRTVALQDAHGGGHHPHGGHGAGHPRRRHCTITSQLLATTSALSTSLPATFASSSNLVGTVVLLRSLSLKWLSAAWSLA